MAGKNSFSRKPLQTDEQNLIRAQAERDNQIVVSSAKIDTSNQRFYELLKAEFKKRVFGTLDMR